MKRGLFVFLLAGTCFNSLAHASPWDKVDELVAELARRAGTTVDRLRVDPATSALENNRRGTLRLEKYLMAEPSRAAATVEAMASTSSFGPYHPPDVQSVPSLLVQFTRLTWDHPSVPRALDVEAVKLPRDTSSNPVADAMKRLYADTGRRFQGKDRAKVIEDSRQFPPQLQTQVAALIDAVAQASRMRESVVKSSDLKHGGAFEGKSKKTANLLRDFLNRWWEADLATDPKMSRLTFALETFDRDALYAGAIPLARSLDTAADTLSKLQAQGSIHSDWQTPLGRIAVGGNGNDTYSGAYALIVDLGGDDVYRGPGAVSGQDAVSLVLDFGGDDRYSAGDSALAGPGGAVLGYAGIVDVGTGKDTYEATSWAGGFGCLGVGWIDDRGGNDTYRTQCLSQGSGLFGIGLLLDGDGQDQFTLVGLDSAFAIGQSQGFGGPLGIGALIDLNGDDNYVDTHPRWGGPQDWVQGAAWGGNGQWSGGFGWLLDAGGGNDTYKARLNAQGAGVGSGLGVLTDDAGNDEYWTEYQSQGFGWILGVGILYDGAGDDRHRAHDDAIGCGKNLGMGMLLEGSGDDIYFFESEEETEDFSPNVASSESQGAGWLLDLEGNDTYPEGRGIVKAASSVPWRAPAPGVCVFIDAGQPNTEETYTPCGGGGPAVGGVLILPAPKAATNPNPSSP